MSEIFVNIPHWLILSKVYQQKEATEKTLEKIMEKAPTEKNGTCSPDEG